MSDTPAPGSQNGQGAPSLRVLAQYLKDLSFENPRAPLIYSKLQGAPSMAVNVDVNARSIGDNQYEVELSVSAKSTHDDETVFVAETAYAGAFEIVNIPQEQLELVLLVECPRILFPFLRQVLADVTQSGNFPPVMLDPIDFLTIYEQRRRRGEASQNGEGAIA